MIALVDFGNSCVGLCDCFGQQLYLEAVIFLCLSLFLYAPNFLLICCTSGIQDRTLFLETVGMCPSCSFDTLSH